MIKRRHLHSIIFFVFAWAFFAFLYPNHLRFLESQQTFLYTKEFLIDTFWCPGGFVNLIGRFIIQFYHVPVLGAAFIALLLVLLQKGIACFCRVCAVRFDVSDKVDKDRLYPLTYFPAFLSWALLLDADYTVMGLVALVAAVWVGTISFSSPWKSFVWAFFLAPMAWFLLGGAASVAVVLFCLGSLIRRGGSNAWAGLLALFAAAVCVWLAPRVGPLWNTRTLFMAATYYRLAIYPLTRLLTIWASVVVVVVLSLVKATGQRFWVLFMSIFVSLSGATILYFAYDRPQEELCFYYVNTHKGRWQAIIDHPVYQKEMSPLVIPSINLALAKTGTLGDKAFYLPQRDAATLFPAPEAGDWLISGEILFHLGFVNEAQRYAHEAMELEPDFQKGAFYMTRLAETNLLAARTDIAQKYLHTLEHTLFYKRWAKDMLRLDSTLVAAHPLYGPIAAAIPDANFFFDATLMDSMLRTMLQQHPDNALAMDYLRMLYLLTRQMSAFVKTLPQDGVASLPEHYREAVALFYTLRRQDFDLWPYPVDEQTAQQATVFINLCAKAKEEEAKGGPKVADAVAPYFGKTYWYFYTFALNTPSVPQLQMP